MINRNTQHVLTLIFSVLIFMPSLGNTPFWEWDEASYSEASREMLASSDFIIPTLNMKPFLEKPPLLYWLQMLCFSFFGDSEFTARLPSAIASILTAALVTEIALMLFAGNSGLISGIVCSTSLILVTFGRSSFLDSVFSFTTTLALYSYFKSEKNVAWTYLCGVAIGFSMLSRGFFGIIFPMSAIISYSAFSCDFSWVKSNKTKIIVVTSLLIGLPWFLAVEYLLNNKFLISFLYNENLSRFNHAPGIGAEKHYYYLLVLFIGCAPWTGFLIPIFVNLFKNSINKTINNDQLILFLSLTAPIAVLSLSATKWPHYILAIFPILAILIGKEIDQSFNDKKLSFNNFCGIFGLLFFIIFVKHPYLTAGWFYKEPQLQYSFWSDGSVKFVFILIGTIGIVMSLLFNKISLHNFSKSFFVFSCFSFSALYAQTAMLPISKIDPLRNTAKLFQETSEESSYGVYMYKNLGLSYYLKKFYFDLKDKENLLNFLNNQKRAVVLIKLKDWEKYKNELELSGVRIIAEYYNPIEKTTFLTIGK